MTEPIRKEPPVVKICGLTNWEDAWVATQAGTDFLGFIFYEKSPRYVPVETVKTIVQRLRQERPEPPPYTVGVFVNASVETVQTTLDESGLDYAQLHGDETPAILEALNRRAYKALRPLSKEEADADAGWYAPLAPKGRHAPKILIDAYHPNLYGGSGLKANWDILAYLTSQRFKIIMAGGLTPENVAEAVRYVGPWGVDVSSGVEAAPGKKDPEKVIAFIRAAKTAWKV